MKYLPIAFFVISSLFFIFCSGWDREYRLRFWERYRIQAEAAHLKHKRKVYREYARQAVDQAMALGEKDFHLVVSLIDFGDACRVSGDSRAAEEAYRKALSVTPSTAGAPDLEQKLNCQNRARTLLEMGNLLIEKKQYVRSVSYFKQAARAYESLCPGDIIEDNLVGQDLACSYSGLARAEYELGGYEKAEGYAKKALGLCRRSAFSELMLDDIYDVYRQSLIRLGRKSDIEKIFADKRWNELTAAGLLACKAGRLTEAESYFLQATAAAEKSEQGKSKLIKSHLNLARLYLSWGRTGDLERCCEESLSVCAFLDFDDRYDINLDRTMSMLATIYSATGAAAKAIPVFKKQYAYRLRYCGHESLLCGETLAALARAYYFAGRNKEALIEAKAALVVLLPAYAGNKKAAPAMADLGAVFESLSLYQPAEELYKCVDQLNNKLHDRWDNRIIAGKTALCRLYMRTHRLKELKSKNREILDSLSEMPVKRRIETAPYLVVLGSIYVDGGAYALADSVYSELKEITRTQKTALPLNTKMRQELERNMKSVDKKLGIKNTQAGDPGACLGV